MTVTTTDSRISYIGDGTSVAFPFPYYFLAPTDIDALLDSIEQKGGFTVTGAGNPQGGTVTFTTAPAVGVSILLVRSPDLLQSTDFPPNDPFPADAVERGLDKLTMIAQKLIADEGRSVRFPLSEIVDGELPLAGQRASKVYAFDVNGNPTFLPLPSSIGAGDLSWELGVDGTRGFKTGADFTPNVTEQLTLSRSPGNDANVWVYWDAAPQTDFSISGNKLNFPTAIPNGISIVNVRIGTVLSLNVPATQSVGDAQLSWGRVLKRIVGSVAALAALNVAVYQEAFATDFGLGYGGGGPYSYNAALAQSNANGATIVAAAGGVGCWVLQPGSDVSIETFGGAPNGSDCGPAINAAIADSSVSRLHARGAAYTVNTALNFTNRTVPLVFYGDGGYYQQNTGTVLTFKTGGWMADLTGCQFLHLEHMRWVALGGAGSSTMGLLVARSTTQDFGMYNTGFKMCVELASSAGSAAGSIALADNCAENCQFNQCWFVADTPYASTLANELNFASPYATIANTIFSNTDKSFRQCVFQARNGYANVFYGLADTTFDQCNWTLLGALGAGVNAAIACNASIQGYRYCSNIRFTGDFESFPAIAYLAGNTAALNFDCTTANLTGSASLVPYTNTTHDGLRLKVNQLSGTQSNLILSTGAGVVVNNGEIFMASGQTLLDGNLTLNGGLIYGGANDLSDSGIFSINGASSFRATYANSTLRGSVVWNPGTVPANSTVSEVVAIANVVGNSVCRVYPPGSLAGCVAQASVQSTGSVLLSVSNTSGGGVPVTGGTWLIEVDKVYA